MVPRARKGMLARVLSGLDAKTVTTLVIALGGVAGAAKSQWDVREQEARQAQSTRRSGVLRARVDSLAAVVEDLQAEVDALRAGTRGLRRDLRRHDHGRWAPARVALDSVARERAQPEPEKPKAKKGWFGWLRG